MDMDAAGPSAAPSRMRPADDEGRGPDGASPAVERRHRRLGDQHTHKTLKQALADLGMPSVEEGSKRERVERSLAQAPDGRLAHVVERFLPTQRTDAPTRNLLRDAMWAPASPPETPLRTRTSRPGPLTRKTSYSTAPGSWRCWTVSDISTTTSAGAICSPGGRTESTSPTSARQKKASTRGSSPAFPPTLQDSATSSTATTASSEPRCTTCLRSSRRYGFTGIP